MDKNRSIRRYIDFLPKLTNYAVGLILICYIIGFVIANLYLGSLKIVNLDVIRARYVLVGVLFVIFVSGIVYLTYGLIRAIQQHSNENPIKLVGKLMWYSLQNIAVLLFVIPAVGVLAGTVSTLPVGLPNLSPAVAITEWLEFMPKETFLRSLKLTSATIIAIAITFIVLIVINPTNKDGVKEPRKDILRKIGKDKWSLFGFCVAVFIFLFLWDGLLNLLNFLTTNTISPQSADATPSGWSRFLGGMITIYLLIAVVVTFIKITRRSSAERKDEDSQDDNLNNPTASISAFIYFIAMIISIVLPVYALGIYPTIPQQIGGGKVFQVDVFVEDEIFSKIFSSPDNEVYLIDRTTKSSLFLVYDDIAKEYEIMEVDGSQIKSIIYDP